MSEVDAAAFGQPQVRDGGRPGVGTRTEAESGAQTIAFVAVFFILVSLCMTAMLWRFRAPFPDPAARSFVQSFLLFAGVAFAIQQSATWVLRDARRSYTAVAGAAIGLLLLPIALGANTLLGWLFTALLGLICIRGAFDATRRLRGVPIWQLLLLLAGPPALASIYFLLINTLGYAHALAPEFALVGLVNRDTLYHSALASLISQHGVVSIGLDGLVPIKYHFFSHLWLGRTSQWLGERPLYGYVLLTKVVLAPLIFLSCAVAGMRVWDERSTATPAPVLVVLAPLAVLALVEVYDWSSYLISESHLFAMTVFLLGLPLLTEMVRETPAGYGAYRLLLVLAIGAVLAPAKTSVGAVWFCGVAYALGRPHIRLRLSPRTLAWAGLAVLAAAAALVVGYQALPQDHVASVEFEPLHFIKTFPAVGRVNIAAMAAGLFAAAWLWRRAGPSERSEFELFPILILAALIPTLLIRLEGGSAYYFANVGVFTAVVLVGRTLATPSLGGGWAAAIASLVLVAAIALSTHASTLKYYSFRYLTEFVQQLRAALDPAQAGAISPRTVAAMAGNLDHIAAFVGNAPGKKMQQRLLRDVGFGAVDVVVFVPPGNQAYWTMHKDCPARSLFVPALIGVPLIRGYPPNCDPGPFFGYTAYAPDARAEEASDSDLCARAERLGYRKVYVLSAPDEGRMVTCSGMP